MFVEDFVGHIGGDDFVMIVYDYHLNELCQRLIYDFTDSIQSLYSIRDYEQGILFLKIALVCQVIHPLPHYRLLF